MASLVKGVCPQCGSDNLTETKPFVVDDDDNFLHTESDCKGCNLKLQNIFKFQLAEEVPPPHLYLSNLKKTKLISQR